jgi:diadenosine tetraphosphate (Ap4A) HIT family hydrolase
LIFFAPSRETNDHLQAGTMAAPARPNVVEDRVKLARAGQKPYIICKMASGWLVIGDRQPLPGYCLLLADPVATSINDLNGSERCQFLADMALIGDALLEVTQAHRVNYEILGNQAAALHAHITPRFPSELAIFRRASPAVRRIFGRRFDANVDSSLIFSLKDAIERLR